MGDVMGKCKEVMIRHSFDTLAQCVRRAAELRRVEADVALDHECELAKKVMVTWRRQSIWLSSVRRRMWMLRGRHGHELTRAAMVEVRGRKLCIDALVC